MKLVKLFAESGAAGIHIEDQLHGGKKVGNKTIFTFPKQLAKECFSPSAVTLQAKSSSLHLRTFRAS